MLTKFWHTMRALAGRRAFEAELEAELEDHIVRRAEELIEQGISPREALQRARRQFGSVELVKDGVRDSYWLSACDSAARCLRISFRTLRRNPVFSATAIITLALGLGASTAIFSVVNAVLLRDLPYSEPHRIYRLYSVTPEGLPEGFIAPRDMAPLEGGHTAVESAAIGYYQEGRIQAPDGTYFNTGGYGATEQFFEVFTIPMQMGRAFGRDDTAVVVLAHNIWRDVFGSDPDILGKLVVVDGGAREVTGVAPPGFNFPSSVGYWELIRPGGALETLRGFDGYLRLRAGVTQDYIEENLAALSTELGPDATTHEPVQFVVRPMLRDVVGDLRPTVLLLFGASAALLLVACINVSSLLLTRGLRRMRETAMREALGAKRGHVVSTLLVESSMLSLAGGALGLLVAVLGLRALLRIAPADLPRLETVTIDANVLWFAIAITAATALVAGTAPALRVSGNGIRHLLCGRSGLTRGHQRILSSLVVAEIALAVLLMIGAGLLVRSYGNLTSTDPGFDSARLLSFYMEVPYELVEVETGADGRPVRNAGSYDRIVSVLDSVMDRLRTVPGVQAVSGASSAPFGRHEWDVRASAALLGRPSPSVAEALPQVMQRAVHPGFFETMGIRLIAGRGLAVTDTRTSRGVAVVNEAYVRRHLEGGEPIGRRISLPDEFFKIDGPGFAYGLLSVDEVQIVGVVSDVKYEDLAKPAEPTIYLSDRQYAMRRYNIFVRTSLQEPEDLIPAIRSEVQAVDSRLAVEFSPYEGLLRAKLARHRLGATLLGVFGSIALILASVGIYGVMAYAVAQRSGELAVRAAVGATARDLRALVLRRGLLSGALGAALGVVAAAALGRVVAGLLHEVGTHDWRVFVSVPIALLVVTALSSYIPALRASRSDPVSLLRAG